MKSLRISVVVAMVVAMLTAFPGLTPAVGMGDPGAAIRTSADAPSAEATRAAAVPGVVLVKARPSSKSTVAALDALPGVSAADVTPGRNRTAKVKTPRGRTDEQFLQELRASSAVEFAEPNYIRQVSAYTVPPNDPGYTSTASVSWGGPFLANARSWWMRDINANGGMNVENLWGSLEASSFPARASSAAIKVAVIDTGFYMDHPDRGPNIIAGRDEFATYTDATGVMTKDNDVSPVDPAAPLNSVKTTSHGTCIAGQIGAQTNNGIGIAGVTYDTTVLVYKVQGVWIDGDPAGGYPPGCAVILDTAIIDAINDATAAGAKVINMSIAGPKYSRAIQDAINHAWASGVLVVAPTGNAGMLDGVQYPGANAHVVGVGSYTMAGSSTPSSKTRSSFTDYGVGRDAAAAGANNGRLDILAPGEGIFGLIKPGYDADGAGTFQEPGYYWWQGTSMASPAFAGFAATVWRFAPALTPDELAGVFYATAADAGSTSLGYGYMNPTAAYAKLKSDYPYLLAPAALALPTSTNTVRLPVRWSPVAGRAVSYDLSDNGVFVKNVTGVSTFLDLAGEGSHEVSVSPRSNYNWWTPGTSKSGTVLVDFTVESGVLSGTVTHEGSPLGGVAVSVPGTATVTTAPDGTYSVAGITPGGYGVVYSKSGFGTQTHTVVINPASSATQSVSLNVAVPVYRFYNRKSGSHFYTASEAEKNNVVNTLSPTYSLDGVAYSINTAAAANNAPLYRFYNRQTGAHFYTASVTEKNNVQANLSAIYSYDGPAYNVCVTPLADAQTVYRFYNKINGAHFYTASEAEKNSVLANLSATYVLDGPAFYLAP